MNTFKKIFFSLMLGISIYNTLPAQTETIPNNAGWFSLGARSTFSLFSSDGAGIGTGGQFRIQLSNKVNTDWFADYISIYTKNNIRSEYYHIGWSVLFYPFNKLQYPSSKIQPYVLAGHCFDFNKKTLLSDASITASRWGSAVQAGLGLHFNLSERFDISLTSQYMIHLTSELEVVSHSTHIHIEPHKHAAIEGHMLSTISVNYKLFRIWKGKS